MNSALLHCVYTCRRDRDRLAGFLRAHPTPGRPTDRRALVFGADGTGSAAPGPEPGEPSCESWFLDAPDLYELLPVKTYAMLKRALTEPDWDYLLKTDVDCRIDRGQVAEAMRREVRYAGRVVGRHAGAPPGNWHFRKCRHRTYEERCPAELFPSPQVGYANGPAYLLHREAVEAVAERGVYFAMRHIFEDVMVGKALEGSYRVEPFRLTRRAGA